MSISQLTSEQIQEMAMIEIAYMLLEEEKQALSFYDLFNKVAELKGLTEEQKEDRIAQFYTDVNVDGRFLCIGENRWGLKRWYPYDQADEEVHVPSKPKKKKGKKKPVEDDEELYDDFEDEDYDEDSYDDDDYSDDDLGDDLDDEDEDLEDDFDDIDDLDEEDVDDDEDLLDDEFDLDDDFDDSEDEDDLDDLEELVDDEDLLDEEDED